MNLKLLRKKIKENGIGSQKELATKCGISESMVCRILKGDRKNIQISTAQAIKVGLKLTDKEATAIFFGK